MLEVAPCIRPERHDARNEFCVNPIGFGACASARREAFDLRRQQLPCRDPGGVAVLSLLYPQFAILLPSAALAEVADGAVYGV